VNNVLHSKLVFVEVFLAGGKSTSFLSILFLVRAAARASCQHSERDMLAPD
jgi:hypothetical protein